MEEVYQAVKKLTYKLIDNGFQKKASSKEIAKEANLTDSSVNRCLKKGKYYGIKMDIELRKINHPNMQFCRTRVYWVEVEDKDEEYN